MAESSSGAGTPTYGKNIKMVAAGANFTLALKNDGTVWTWGRYYHGEMGNGSKSGYIIRPTQIKGLADIAYISAGLGHAAAVKNDGSVYIWGEYQRLKPSESPGNAIHYKPVRLEGISNVVSVASSNSFDIALKKDGTVWAWGVNGWGQLGNGTIDDSMTPSKVSGLGEIIKVTAGADSCMALKKDGTVWGWGDNSIGSLGMGTVKDAYLIPEQIKSISDIIDISSHGASAVALRRDGTVLTWGFSIYGVLGGGTEKIRIMPAKVTGMDNVANIFTSSTNVYTVKSDGTLWGWGYNANSELPGSKALKSAVPVRLGGVSGVACITGDTSSIYALKKDGTLEGWGAGPIGDGTVVKRKAPVKIALEQPPVKDVLGNEVSAEAKEAVFALWKNDLAVKTLFGEFKSNIKRDEFLALFGYLYLGKANWNLQYKAAYSDIDDSQYSYYITEAKMLEITGETFSNKFGPGKETSRQDAAVMVYNTLKATGKPGSYSVKPAKLFSDDKDIDATARQAIYYLYAKGIISPAGSNRFDPSGKLAKQEAMVWAYKTGKLTGYIK